MAQHKKQYSNAKKVEKPLSTLLQELVSSSPMGCLSTCEAVRALRRMAPPILRNMTTIRLRKKITDCLTRNPAFTIALDHLRHGIRPRYALQGTDVAAAGGQRSVMKRSHKSLDTKNDSLAHIIKTGDMLIHEVFEKKRMYPVNIIPSSSKKNHLINENPGGTVLFQNNYNADRLSPIINKDTQVDQYLTPLSRENVAYTHFPSTPRFPKINFPDLLTPPDSYPRYSTSELIASNGNHSPEFNSIHYNLVTTPYTPYNFSPYQGNLSSYPKAQQAYDLSPIQCNLFPFTAPAQSSSSTMGLLPHLSSDEVTEYLTL